MDQLDQQLNAIFPGKVVRKDLVHQIKKAANVPSFVLEFLLSKYCATDDPQEIEEGKKAVLTVVEQNYVRPDEANRAQSLVSQKGRHKFIDKVHVRYIEKERRHWAEMENFGSRRIAVNEKFYRENEKLLEGGMWAEVTLAHNDVEGDDYAFYVEDLKPIQLARFSEQNYFEGRKAFSRDEWLNVIIRSVGLNPELMDHPPDEIKGRFPEGFRLKMHFVARLIPLVVSNYNFIELGPRGTGKSYFYSEFSPYSTLLSGGQASTATLLYNNARRKIGAVGYWDTIAFDEVGNMKIRDSDTVQIMKDYMANGRFSRGKEVIAAASFAFVGNIDHSIDQLVKSYDHDLFITLPKAFDLAVQDRFFYFLPGWEIPKMDHKYYASNFGLITDYMAEAFHYLFKHNKDYVDLVNRRMKLGPQVQGRDEIAIKKTVMGLLKILHPVGEPSDEEFNDLVQYAVEGRRRVKEQMNKRKPDDEFALINLSYFDQSGVEHLVFCPESRQAKATQNPRRIETPENEKLKIEEPSAIRDEDLKSPINSAPLQPKKVKILYGDTGYSYENLFGPYLHRASEIIIEDPYIRQTHQIVNLIRFCEVAVKIGDVKKIILVTDTDDTIQWQENSTKFESIATSLSEHGVQFTYRCQSTLHDREIRLNNGWTIILGRGLDYFQSLQGECFTIGANDMELRACLETSIDFQKV